LLHQINEGEDVHTKSFRPIARAAGLYERTASLSRKPRFLGLRHPVTRSIGAGHLFRSSIYSSNSATGLCTFVQKRSASETTY
jgi:hypothetical protein